MFSNLKTKKRFILPIIGLIAFLLYILIFNVDISTLASVIITTNLWFFGLALIVGIANLLFFSISWKVLLSFLKVNISNKKSFLYILYGNYMDIIVPAGSITGDVARVYLIAKNSGSQTKAAASVFIQRLLGMALNIITIVLGLALIFTAAHLNRTVVFYVTTVGGMISLALIFLIALIAKKSLSIKIINGSLTFIDKITSNKWNVSKRRDQIDNAIDKFRDAVTTFKGFPRALTTSMLYLSLAWFCNFTIPYIIFLSLYFPVPLSTIIITSSIVVAIRAIPVGIPFEVGIPEITMTTLFIALGVPADISATATILTRIVTLWFTFALGFFAQQWLELKPKSHHKVSPLKLKSPCKLVQRVMVSIFVG